MRIQTSDRPASRRSALLGAVAVASLLLSGCAAAVAAPAGTSSSTPSHTMPGGGTMSGAGHDAHSPAAGATPADTATGPSEAAMMVCEGQVLEAVTTIFALDTRATGTWAWDAPDFTCTYDIEGQPLTLTVYDVDDVAVGEKYFADLKAGFSDAKEIEGMAALGMPSFSTADGTVAFLRDGKTLTVDATALPGGLGASGDRTQEQAAYNLASAVLACWVQHD